MWKDFFEFTKKERQGIIALFVILILVMGIYWILPFIEPDYKIKPKDSAQVAEWQKAIMENMQQAGDGYESSGNYYEKLYDTLEMFAFDPNSITKSQWFAIGLNKGQVKTILNYRQNGGRFFTPEDVLKMYTIDSAQYAYLKPWIRIKKSVQEKQTDVKNNRDTFIKKEVFQPETLFTFNPNSISIKEWQKLGVKKSTAQTIHKYLEAGARFDSAQELASIYSLSDTAFKSLMPYVDIPEPAPGPKIELNTATRKDLEALYGIGPYFAKMIIKYRNLLGGYYHKSQLLEVYNFKEKTYHAISGKVKADTTKIKKIALHKADYKELIRHPYINKLQTQEILGLIKKDNLKSIEILRDKKIFSDTIFTKVQHYLLMKGR